MLNEETQKLIKEYNESQERIDKLRDKLEKIFTPMIDEAYQNGGEKEAFKIANLMPDNVDKAFAMDRIRYILPYKNRKNIKYK